MCFVKERKSSVSFPLSAEFTRETLVETTSEVNLKEDKDAF